MTVTADYLYQLAQALSRTGPDETKRPMWNKHLAEAPIRVLVDALGLLRGGGMVVGPAFEALREQLQSAIASRLADNQVAAAARLADSADALNRRILRATQIGSAFGGIGVLLAVVALVRAFLAS